MNLIFDGHREQEQLNLLLEILSSEGESFPYEEIKLKNKDGVILMLMNKDTALFDTDYFIHLINSHTLATAQWYAENKDEIEDQKRRKIYETLYILYAEDDDFYNIIDEIVKAVNIQTKFYRVIDNYIEYNYTGGNE